MRGDEGLIYGGGHVSEEEEKEMRFAVKLQIDNIWQLNEWVSRQRQ